MIQRGIRCFSSGAGADGRFRTLQTILKGQSPTTFTEAMNAAVRQANMRQSNPLTEMMRFWAAEKPGEEALRIFDKQKNGCVKLTFEQVDALSSRLANVLTGKDFCLTSGKSVLVILPNDSKERILLQLACLQIGLTFCPYEPKDFSDVGLSQRIRALGIDCVITNREHMDVVANRTREPLRPLKRGLITDESPSEPLPVGWNRLHADADYAERKPKENTPTPAIMPAVRLSLNDHQFAEYSQEQFCSLLLSTGLWLNREKTSRLIWMRNNNEPLSIAPWLFGSSIFQKRVDNLPSLLDTLENNPIDTFCGSSSTYQLLGQPSERQHRTHLEQLFATQSIDPKVKANWYSLTQLMIRDDYADLSSRPSLNI